MQDNPPAEAGRVGVPSCSSEDHVRVVEHDLEVRARMDVVDSMVRARLGGRGLGEVGTVAVVPRGGRDRDARRVLREG